MSEEFSISKLEELISKKDINQLKQYMKKNNLILQNKKILPKDTKEYENKENFWDQRQHIRKILLNSAYGSLLNEYCRFYDNRIGQSVTLTGRSITKHMISKTNEIITGNYDHKGDTIYYSDTDSVEKTTCIKTNYGNIEIQNLFKLMDTFWNNKDKEYGYKDDLKVLTYDSTNNTSTYDNINYIYKHKVTKPKWKITDKNNNELIITEDHSIMVERNNKLLEIKPFDIKEDDKLISYLT